MYDPSDLTGRRRFLANAAALAWGSASLTLGSAAAEAKAQPQQTGPQSTGPQSTGPQSAGPPRRRLRVVAYNVYKCLGWPRDQALARQAAALGQMPARFANELALYEPDVIGFSEAPSEPVVRQIAKRLGMHAVYFPSGRQWPGAILSRLEIVDSQNAPVVAAEQSQGLFTRHWGRATLRLDDGGQLAVHTAHLYPGEAADVRLREIPAMLRAMQADMQAKRSMLLIGDLNHTPSTKEYELWREAGWSDTFVAAGGKEATGLTFQADRPQRRIDYVMAAGPLARQVVESRPLFEGAFRLHEGTFALSDHLPQLAVFDLGRDA